MERITIVIEIFQIHPSSPTDFSLFYDYFFYLVSMISDFIDSIRVDANPESNGKKKESYNEKKKKNERTEENQIQIGSRKNRGRR